MFVAEVFGSQDLLDGLVTFSSEVLQLGDDLLYATWIIKY